MIATQKQVDMVDYIYADNIVDPQSYPQSKKEL
jgi:hypothetical protein